MDINMILREAHSGVRWLVLLVTIIALVKLVLGLIQSGAYDQLTQRIMIAFSGLITVQWLLGLILFLVLEDSFSLGYRWEHAGIMTVATGVSHVHMRWKNADDRTRYRNSLIIVAIVLALVFVGVWRLPQGWTG